jgi:hypothetical protein
MRYRFGWFFTIGGLCILPLLAFLAVRQVTKAEKSTAKHDWVLIYYMSYDNRQYHDPLTV